MLSLLNIHFHLHFLVLLPFFSVFSIFFRVVFSTPARHKRRIFSKNAFTFEQMIVSKNKYLEVPT